MHLKLQILSSLRKEMKSLRCHFGIASVNSLNEANGNLKLPIEAVSSMSNWFDHHRKQSGERPNG